MEKQLIVKYLKARTIKPILFAALLAVFVSQSVFADDISDVRSILQEKFDNIIIVLENKLLDDESKMAKIEDIIKPIFDFPLMSKLSLGRESWTDMTKEEHVKFAELFTKVFKQAYLSKILGYADEDIIFKESDQVGKKIYISSFIVSKEKKTSVLYKFYQSGDGWKIYDVEIEGVSYIQSYRSQYTESLKEMTVTELMAKMEKLISSR
ncbi:phospholipid-binding protein MlaC [Thermodesulfobacteriota bacterium]